MNTLGLNLQKYVESAARDYAEACSQDGLTEAEIDIFDASRRFVEDTVDEMPKLSKAEIGMIGAFFAMTLSNYIRSI